jgi:anaerobic selenocysteine-containing dehydrogenase
VGWGLGRRGNGSTTIRTLDALAAVSGNLGIRGGGASYYFQRRGGFDTSFIKRPENAGTRTLLEPRLGEELLAASPKIRVAVIDNGNPVTQLPDSKTVARGLESVDFLVVLDAFVTDTAELAHVVLPTTTMLEEHDVVAAYGHSYVQLSRPVAPPPDGARSDFRIYQALAQRLGLDALDGDEITWIDRFLAPMAAHGVTRASLADGGQRKPEAPHVLYEGRRFPTPSGRFRLLGDFPATPPALEDGYPLTLMSISTYRSQSSQIAQGAQREPPRVTVHPDSANGLGEGAPARLVSPLGEVPVVVHLDPRQRRDLVIFHKGRWAKFGGPNTLIRARVTDAGEGAAYYDQGVRLEP